MAPTASGSPRTLVGAGIRCWSDGRSASSRVAGRDRDSCRVTWTSIHVIIVIVGAIFPDDDEVMRCERLCTPLPPSSVCQVEREINYSPIHTPVVRLRMLH